MCLIFNYYCLGTVVKLFLKENRLAQRWKLVKGWVVGTIGTQKLDKNSIRFINDFKLITNYSNASINNFMGR